MSQQTLSNKSHQDRYSEAIRQAREQGSDSFQNWFNQSGNTQEAIVRGFWDFTTHILTPTVCDYITSPEQKTALEIGYGGGRILNAASKYFRFVTGIDVHDEQVFVETFLKSQGNENFQLLRTSGDEIDVPPESIDFVYSFIVLQHLPTLDALINYINATYRCLKPGGIAQLYFGKFTVLSPLDQAKFFGAGYKEITDAVVNNFSLVLRLSKMRRICTIAGFQILDSGTSYKKAPDGYRNRKGLQNYVTLRKK